MIERREQQKQSLVYFVLCFFLLFLPPIYNTLFFGGLIDTFKTLLTELKMTSTRWLKAFPPFSRVLITGAPASFAPPLRIETPASSAVPPNLLYDT